MSPLERKGLQAARRALPLIAGAALLVGTKADDTRRATLEQPRWKATASLLQRLRASAGGAGRFGHLDPVPGNGVEAIGVLGGPVSAEEERYRNRAFPADDVPMEATLAARQAFSDDSSRSEEGRHVPSSWTEIGPTNAVYPAVLTSTGAQFDASGRITFLAIAPSCSQARCRLYVGAAGGGIWRTDTALDSQPTWTFVSQSLPTNAIGVVRIDPGDPSGNTVWVGTGEPNASADSEAGLGIFLSTDGGGTWTQLPAVAVVGGVTFDNFPKGRSISEIAFDSSSPGAIYVSITRGIRGYSSVCCGGVTSNPPPPVAPLGLYKSSDGGNSFTRIWDGAGSLRGVNAVELDPRNPNTVYAAAYQQGIWRSSPDEANGAFQQIFRPTSPLFNTDQTMFALTVQGGHTRIYAGDGAQGPGPSSQESQVWRSDNADVPAATLLATQTTPQPGGWKKLTSSAVGDPGFATFNYCTGQCWYDNRVYTPPGQPDTVFVLGSIQGREQGRLSNGRLVLRSTTAGEPDPAHNNRTFTDLSFDASGQNPNFIHADQHAMVFMPGNPVVWFEGSDGGLVRSSGAYADVSGQCDTRRNRDGTPLTPDQLVTCRRLLSAVPTFLFNLNKGLATIQFQSVSINPGDPTSSLLGGTQDNGTFLFDGGFDEWQQQIGGDGGQSGFNAADPNIRYHTFFSVFADTNFRGDDVLGWVFISDPLINSGESAGFYTPFLADPNPARAGSIFAGLQGVWRTQDNGGSRAFLEANCSEFFPAADPTAICGDFVELGSPLTSAALGTRAGGVIAAVARRATDTGTLWSATSTGRVFLSRNADGPAGAVTFTRLDTLSPAAPGRFVSGIAVDPSDPNHAWISYSGYNFNTPAQPGHVFEVTFVPAAGTSTWNNLDGGTGPLGDLPVTGLIRDDPTADLFAATDFGVMRLPTGTTHWQAAGPGMPMVEVAGLSISTSARQLYAATHGRGAFRLVLPALN
jgi:hypothetical protein